MFFQSTAARYPAKLKNSVFCSDPDPGLESGRLYRTLRAASKISYLLIATGLLLLLSTCRRETSVEGGVYATACINDYTASCKLLKIDYEAASVLGATNTVDLTWAGDQLSTATDQYYNRTFTWQGGLIVKIEYRSAATNFRDHTETINYTNINGSWKVSQIRSIIYTPSGIDSSRIVSSYNSSGRLVSKQQAKKPHGNSTWVTECTYDYSYDAAGNVYQMIINDARVNPVQKTTVPLTWTGNCNTWQKVFPGIELLDYSGREERGGISVLFTSRLFAATTNGLFTTYTLNSSKAVQKFYQDNKLIATYTYDCP